MMMANPENAGRNMTIPQLNEKLEKLRSTLIDPSRKLTKDSFIILISELQPIYSKLIMMDLEAATKRQLENFLWNDCFKNPLTKLMKGDKVLFNFIIETGVGFYLGFIQDIGLHFDVPFIKNSLRAMYCSAPKMKQVVKCCPSKTVVYYIIQNSLVHMGDLLRYGGSFKEAHKMYDKSTALSPSNGHPYNQLGLVQLLMDSKSMGSLFNGIYYYVRAVCTSSPFVLAQQNLDGLFGKVKTVTPTSPLEEFLSLFLQCVGDLSETGNKNDISDLLTSLLATDSIMFQELVRVLVIGIWAWQRESNQIIMGSDRSNEGEALELVAMLVNGVISAADTATFNCIGLLNIFLEWTRLNSSVTSNAKFRGKLKTTAICDFINYAVEIEQSYVVEGLDHVILPEEKKLLGFAPVSRAFEHLQSVMDESDPRLNSLRLNHFLNAAKSQPGTFIQQTDGKFIETPLYQPSAIRAPSRPSRRNVALQSILQFSQEASDRAHFEPVAAHAPIHTPTILTPARGPTPQNMSLLFQGDTSSLGVLPTMAMAQDNANAIPSQSQSQQDSGDLSDSSSTGLPLFHSIWTPFEPETTVWKF